MQKTVMQLYFLIPDISLTLAQDDQAEEQKMITASVTGISVCAWLVLCGLMFFSTWVLIAVCVLESDAGHIRKEDIRHDGPSGAS